MAMEHKSACERIELTEAVSREDREAVYRFRYRIYVEEMGRTPADADHERRTITDQLDDHAQVFMALCGDRVVGTIRLNIESHGGLSKYSSFYAMESVGQSPSERAIGSAVMVEPAYRGGLLAIRLIRRLTEAMLDQGARHVFIDCNPHLVEFYKRIGTEIHRPQVKHPDYGLVDVMHLDLLDVSRLQAMRSPIFSTVRNHLARNQRVVA